MIAHGGREGLSATAGGRLSSTLRGKIEANLSTGNQRTIWGSTGAVGRAIWLGRRLRRMYRCYFAMDNREDDAQPRRASRGTDRRHHTEVNRLEKEVCNIGRILP